MSEATTMGRNDLCRCGSGKRYKKCCGPRDAARRQSMRRLLPALCLILLGAGAVAFYASRSSSPSRTSTNASIPALPHVSAPDLAKPTEWVARPQPRGPVPPGKAWSVEHGHWHIIGQTTEAQATEPVAAAEPPETKPVPAPEGPAPPGKVWSSKHGHWHDTKQQ